MPEEKSPDLMKKLVLFMLENRMQAIILIDSEGRVMYASEMERQEVASKTATFLMSLGDDVEEHPSALN